jgi:hypothetical protein
MIKCGGFLLLVQSDSSRLLQPIDFRISCFLYPPFHYPPSTTYPNPALWSIIKTGTNFGVRSVIRYVDFFVFHYVEGFDLLQHPHGDRNRPKRGVFALHSTNFPNSIGITEVELLAIEGNMTNVCDLDAFNSTPIFDLKPA